MRFSTLGLLAGSLAGVTAAPSARWADDPSDALPQGYVTTKNTEFWLDHYPFYFNGANAYWLPQLVYDYQYEQTYEVLRDLGVKVLRTWAFSMVEDELPTTNVTYYQVCLQEYHFWGGLTPDFSTGPMVLVCKYLC